MIRPAHADEAKILTQLSFASKSYWKYPEAYFEIWKNELTISSDYIEQNDVFVFETDGATIGYYSVVDLKEDIEISGITLKKGFWLEHMFIEPEHIGKGIGKSMFQHMRQHCGRKRINEIGILSDPNAKGFYEKMGCRYVREYPSTIKDRTTPYLILEL